MYAIRSYYEGEVIIAFAVPKENSKKDYLILEKEIFEKIRNDIGPIATPQKIYFVSKLPKTVITSYSIHYTKLYEFLRLNPSLLEGLRRLTPSTNTQTLFHFQ